LEDPKRVIIIHGDRKRRTELADFMKANTFQPWMGAKLSEISLKKSGSAPILLILSAGSASPGQLTELKKACPYLGIILLTDSSNPGGWVHLLENNLVDHIHDARFLTGILAASRSEFHRLELMHSNQSYLKTIKRLKSIKNESIRKSLELEEIYGLTLENLMTALDIRDVATFGHSRTVAKYTQVLAQILGISDETRLENIRKGALLHDIGKIAIPDSILKKPAPLTSLEWRKIRLHPSLGYGLIKEIKMVKEVGFIILNHHERFDGQGYPEGRQGEEIPLEARIFSLADALDAITSHRPYRKRMAFTEAKKEIQKNSVGQFDPTVVEAFCSLGPDKWEKIRYETTKLLPSFEEFLKVN
jgi:putative nucleotidyltransferase with HDIG domain